MAIAPLANGLITIYPYVVIGSYAQIISTPIVGKEHSANKLLMRKHDLSVTLPEYITIFTLEF